MAKSDSFSLSGDADHDALLQLWDQRRAARVVIERFREMNEFQQKLVLAKLRSIMEGE